MIYQVTNGILVSVEVIYRNDFSNPFKSEFFFSYRITIENKSDETVQLLRRHWFIHDLNGEHREVEGEGVVGFQPTLLPNDVHQYESACNLNSEFGKMHGKYTFRNKNTDETFEVDIPEFMLAVTHRQN